MNIDRRQPVSVGVVKACPAKAVLDTDRGRVLRRSALTQMVRGVRVPRPWHGSGDNQCAIERSVPDRDGACAMTILPHSMLALTRPWRWWNAFARYMVSASAVLADIVVMVGVSLLAGLAYHQAAYGDSGPLRSFVGFGAAAAGIFVLPGLLRGEYDLT